jgi:hypothetical protein
MFKVQQDKNVYKNYLSQIETCASVRSHPHLFDVILCLLRASRELPKPFITTVMNSQMKTLSIKESTTVAKPMGFPIRHQTS